MQATNLPTSLGQWKRYFDQTFKVIEELIPVIAFGQNKIEFILANLQEFREAFLKDHAPSVPVKEGRILFEFFKTCAAFISLISQYTDENFLQYFFANTVNYQYEELSLLWDSWAVQSSMLLIDAFLDISIMNYANFLDLKLIYESINPMLDSISIPVADALRFKLDDILLILGNVPNALDKETPGIIHHNQFENIKEIGKGAYATVNLAKMQPNGREIAVKELKQVQLGKRNIVSLKRELNALLRLNHPNVLEFIGVTVTPPFCIATKYLSHGSLFDIMHNQKIKLDGFQRQKIALCMARGLEYLDAMRFIHRDFKSQNVLLDQDYNAVICDFGISRQIGPKMTTELGTIQWTAPEILAPNPNSNYDTSADCYSFAIVLWELATEELPYMVMRPLQVAANVLNKHLRPPFPESIPNELKNLIEHCWAQEPRHRPKMTHVRATLEKGSAFFPDLDRKKFEEFVEATKGEHKKIMKIAKDCAEREEAMLLQKLHLLNPLDSTALKLLQQLYQMKYPLTIKLFEDILRLSNQTLSIPVQDAAFEIMKQILSRDDIAKVIDPPQIIDELVTMMDSQPLFVITAVKLVANKIKNIPEMIQKFLSMTTSHVTLEMIQALISQNKDKIKPPLLIHIFSSLKGQFAIAFFRFMLGMFGPLNDFLPLACQTLVYMSLFIKELAKLCETEVEIVRDMLMIPELNDEGRSSLQQHLDSISLTIVNPDGEMNEKMGLIILNFIVTNCFKNNSIDPILPLLCLCSKVENLRQMISASDIWGLVIKGLKKSDINHKNALTLIEKIPICSDEKIKSQIWDKLISTFTKTHEEDVTHAIASLLERYSDFDFSQLIPQILDGINSEDEHYCIMALNLARSLNDQAYQILVNDTFWSSLMRQLTDKNIQICKLIGWLSAAMVEKMSEFPFNADYYIAVLVYLYDNDTTFDAAMPFIVFLSASCKYKKTLVFLQRRYFVKYIEQLPWRYEHDSKVGDAIEYCANALSSFYPQSHQEKKD
ncbi:TKL family protein kinase [Tritrichomonas foetus]|uniref:TKL family protein kinase n=1 Tax=Tritrichomonas foetus TaxID=1144522 RepID=A0A1J4KV42_9EUKA|nr:TKL family protein kinase [Tritrichomonas foetus]|eukprot:OHT13373.1 TKL family protein kinase [Tritrichomonas foetus]